MTEQIATIVIEQTFVDVPHGSSSTPTVDDIAVMPHDNLGGGAGGSTLSGQQISA